MEKNICLNDVKFKEITYKNIKCLKKIKFNLYKYNFGWEFVNAYVDNVFKSLLLKNPKFFNLDIKTAYKEYYSALKQKHREGGDFNDLLEYFEFFNPENFEYFKYYDGVITLKFSKNKLDENYLRLFGYIYNELIKNIKCLNYNSNLNLNEIEIKVYYIFLEIKQFFNVFFIDMNRRMKLLEEAKKERVLLFCNGSFHEQFYFLDENDMKFKNIDTDKDSLESFEDFSKYYSVNIASGGCIEFLEFLNNFSLKECLDSDRYFKNKEIKDLNLGEYALELFVKYSEPILKDASNKLHEYGDYGDEKFEILKIIFDVVKRDVVVLNRINSNNVLCDIKLKLVKNRFFNDVLEKVNFFYFSNPLLLIQVFGENKFKCNSLFCFYFRKLMFFINGLNIFARDYYFHYEKATSE